MIADRIRLARRKAGLALRGLSDAMGGRVTAQAIGKYERGEDIPSSGVLSALAKALKVSIAYLLDTQSLELAGVEFRTKASTSARERAYVETEWLQGIKSHLHVRQNRDVEGAIGQCPIAKRCKLHDVDEAEKLANDVRSHWKL